MKIHGPINHQEIPMVRKTSQPKLPDYSGQTYRDEKQKEFNLSFSKEVQDFGAGDPPCTGYRNAIRRDLSNCDNWFRYWSISDDSAILTIGLVLRRQNGHTGAGHILAVNSVHLLR